MSIVPTLYKNIIDGVQAEISMWLEAENILNLFPTKPVDDVTLNKLIFRHLKDVSQASLSGRLWDPTKTKLDVDIYSQWRYTSGIEMVMEYEDWQIYKKMENIVDSGLDKIGKKPSIQASHYLWTGKRLNDDKTRSNPPDTTQYNFIMDPGTSNGTLTRPLITSTTSAGAWSTVANMFTDMNLLVNQLVERGYKDKNSFYIFYPNTLERELVKRRTTSGDGRFSAFEELVAHGINAARIIPIDYLYIPENGSYADPTTSDWDCYCIDASALRIYYTVNPWTNVYPDQSGTKFPKMNVEAGMAFCPLFIPKENRSDGKIYKGVARITGIAA